MKNRQYPLAILIVFTFFIILASCDKNPTSDDDDNNGNGRIIVNNNSGDLDSRVNYKSEEIDVDTLTIAQKLPVLSKKTPNVVVPGSQDTLQITLVSEVKPPEHEGITLQATDIYIKGNKAYVSYNVAGETFMGGVDIFDITDEYHPKLISSAVFTDTDVNGISVDGGELYLASANELYGFGNYALLERVDLDGGLLSSKSTLVDIPSWAATDVDITTQHVYVTSGADNGYISILDKKNLTKVDSVSVDDARGVSVDKNLENAAVVAGTPARLLSFQGSISPTVYNLEGATIQYSKSTVELHGDNALLALGDGGTQIVNANSGNVIKTIPQPEVDGLTAGETVTNAATVSDNILFMANGLAGIYVASISSKSKDTLDDVVSGDDIKILGKFQFGTDESANHVTYDKNMLFVASGLGGLKILKINMNLKK
jgi:hypothetical protein